MRQLEQRGRRRRLISLRDANDKIGKDFARAFVQKPHHAEIQKTDDVAGQHVDIAGMRIGVEEAVNENLFHHQVRQPRRDHVPIQSRGFESLKIGSFHGIDQLHGQNAPCGGLRESFRDVDGGLLGKLVGEAFQVRGLRAEIQFLLHLPRKLRHDRRGAVNLPVFHMPFQQAGQLRHDAQVQAHRSLHPGTLHFNDALFAIGADGAMNLGHGSGANAGLFNGSKVIGDRTF